MKRILFLIIVGVGTVLVATSIPANALKFELDEEYTEGTAPAGPSPWLTATFIDVGFNQVQLTLDASGLTDGEFVSGWYFNIDPVVAALGFSWFPPTVVSGPSFISGSGVGSNNQNASGADEDMYKAGGYKGDGFDIYFKFETSNDPGSDRFTAGSVATYTFTVSNLTEVLFPESFNFMNEAGYFYSAAHVQGIDNSIAFINSEFLDDDDGSGWIGATTSIAAIPEPATIILIGAGLATLLGIRRKKIIKST
jgi:hypothetical protein